MMMSLGAGGEGGQGRDHNKYTMEVLPLCLPYLKILPPPHNSPIRLLDFIEGQGQAWL